MYVPRNYVHLFMGRRLTPRQLCMEVVATLVTDGEDADCEPLVRWCLLAGSTHTPGVSPVSMADIEVPVGDEAYHNWMQRFLHYRLPSLVPVQPLRPPPRLRMS